MKRDMTVTSRDTSENMFGGDKLYQQRARAALPILVQGTQNDYVQGIRDNCQHDRFTIYRACAAVLQQRFLICKSIGMETLYRVSQILSLDRMVVRGLGFVGNLQATGKRDPTRRIRCLIGGHL